MTALHSDLMRDGDDWEDMTVEDYINDLPDIDTKHGISDEQITDFKESVKNMTWEEVYEEANRAKTEAREAHRKGLITEYWETGRGR